ACRRQRASALARALGGNRRAQERAGCRSARPWLLGASAAHVARKRLDHPRIAARCRLFPCDEVTTWQNESFAASTPPPGAARHASKTTFPPRLRARLSRLRAIFCLQP